MGALETFVDQDRFTGTCYRAANWLKIGQTTGRTRNDVINRGPLSSIKGVYDGVINCDDFSAYRTHQQWEPGLTAS